VVAEVLLELTPHGRDRIGEEVIGQPRIEGASGAQQGNVGDLLQVLGRDATIPEPGGDAPGDRHVEQDYLLDRAFADHWVGCPCRAAQQLVGGAVP
jgi:hypothetical protein